MSEGGGVSRKKEKMYYVPERKAKKYTVELHIDITRLA